MVVGNEIKRVSVGDFFVLKTYENSYNVFFCDAVSETISPHNYNFIPIYEKFSSIPTLNEVSKSNFIGVVSGNKTEYIKNSKEELELIWSFYPSIKPKTIGGYSILCFKKEFKILRKDLVFIGNLNTVRGLIYNGNYSLYAGGNVENYIKLFKQIDDLFKDIGQTKMKLASIIK
jgi:hypothetical protein